MSNVLIMGIDPGTENTGYGLILGDIRTKNVYVHDYGMIKKTTGEIRERIDAIGTQLVALLEKHHPHYIIIEDFSSQGKRAKNTGKVSQDMSFLVEHLRMIGKMNGYPMEIIANDAWKKKTLGARSANKKQVQHYIQWKIPETVEKLKRQPSHVWDAIGIAYSKWTEIIS